MNCSNIYAFYALCMQSKMQNNSFCVYGKKNSIFYEKKLKKLLHFTEKYVRIHECFNGLGKFCPFPEKADVR